MSETFWAFRSTQCHLTPDDWVEPYQIACLDGLHMSIVGCEGWNDLFHDFTADDIFDSQEECRQALVYHLRGKIFEMKSRARVLEGYAEQFAEVALVTGTGGSQGGQ